MVTEIKQNRNNCLTNHTGLRVRMGIHVGVPNRRRDSTTNRINYSGPDVVLTSCISNAANGGQILASEAIYKVFFCN